MGKSGNIIMLITSTVVCLLWVVGISEGSADPVGPILLIEGRVVCDPCRSPFLSNLSKPLPGAGVEFQCHQVETKKKVLNMSATTNTIGYYRLLLEGNHSSENCAVFLKTSPREDCNTFIGNNEYPTLAPIKLYAKKYKVGELYKTEPLRFLTKYVSPNCSPHWDP